jgi:hypothetical protein
MLGDRCLYGVHALSTLPPSTVHMCTRGSGPYDSVCSRSYCCWCSAGLLMRALWACAGIVSLATRMQCVATMDSEWLQRHFSAAALGDFFNV